VEAAAETAVWGAGVTVPVELPVPRAKKYQIKRPTNRRMAIIKRMGNRGDFFSFVPGLSKSADLSYRPSGGGVSDSSSKSGTS
jgi:hypothetical protein